MQLTLYSNNGTPIQLQKNQLDRLKRNVKNSKNRQLYIMANKLANKAVKIKFNLEKTIPKSSMNKEMLKFRSQIMGTIVDLLIQKDKGEILHITPELFKAL